MRSSLEQRRVRAVLVMTSTALVTLSASHRAFVRRHAGAWYERAVYDWDEEDRDAFVAAVLAETISGPSYDLNYPSFHRAWEAARG